MVITTNDKGDKMTSPKYPDIKVSTHHRGTDPFAVLVAVSHAMKANNVPLEDKTAYLDAILAIMEQDLSKAQRAVAVVKETLKWVALAD